MTTWIFEDLDPNERIDFNPANDILEFQNAAVQAGHLLIRWQSDGGTSIQPDFGGYDAYTVLLGGASFTGVSPEQLSSGNFTFAGGGLVLIGDNNTSTSGDAGDNYLTGTASGDFFMGLGGNDTLDGGAGDDLFSYQGGSTGTAYGNDSVAGGDGFDWLILAGAGLVVPTAPVTVNLETGSATGLYSGSITFTSVEGISASQYGDSLVGSGSANYFDPLGGNDTVDGAGGDDTILGWSGNDRFDGGNGTDTVQYDEDPQGIDADLEAGVVSDGFGGSDTLVSIENVTGSEFDDYIAGDAGPNLLDGGPGEDTLEGAAGNDTLDGGGTDTFDFASYSGSPAGVVVNLSASTVAGVAPGTATDGHGNTDTLLNINGVIGSAFADTLVGGDAVEMFRGGAGNDSIVGGNPVDGDWISYADAPAGAVINLLTSTFQDGFGTTDVATGVENVEGSNHDDLLTGEVGPNYLVGRDGDDSLEGGVHNDTLDGGSGNDWVSYASSGTGLNVNLETGAVSDDGNGDVDVVIDAENVIGSANNDFIAGDDQDNHLAGEGGNDTLVGGGGNDTLDGGAGADSMVGGAGDDTYLIDFFSDVAVEGPNQGTDTIITTVGLTISENIENVKYVGAGNTGVIGNALDNFIASLHAGMTLGGLGGIDTVSYSEETISLTINFVSGETTDSSLGASDPDADTLFGFENAEGGHGNDSIIGSTAANVLNGMGGADTMIGGAGSDTYYVNHANDAVVESNNTPGGLVLPGGGGAGAGFLGGVFDTITDTVIASINFSLDNLASAFVERLSLEGTATTGTGNTLANELEGNALANVLSGLSGNDTLDGAGGSDTLDGGADNDTVAFASLAGGVIALLASGTAVDGLGGADTMSGIENLSGSAFNDTLAGDGNANVLVGGLGLDSLVGGDGNDVYGAGATGTAGALRIVFVSDLVVESAAQGFDTVRSNASFTLPAEVENLTLIGPAFWRPYKGTGNDLANIIEGEGAARQKLFGMGGNDSLAGNAGADTLSGGTGADTLIGGAGADVFLFDTALGADTILDFASGTDHINLENAVFTAFGATGAVSSVNVQTGLESAITATSGNAGDGQDYLKYATDTGHLYYDADGSGGGDLSLVATVYSSGATPATLVPGQDLVIV